MASIMVDIVKSNGKQGAHNERVVEQMIIWVEDILEKINTENYSLNEKEQLQFEKYTNSINYFVEKNPHVDLNLLKDNISVLKFKYKDNEDYLKQCKEQIEKGNKENGTNNRMIKKDAAHSYNIILSAGKANELTKEEQLKFCYDSIEFTKKRFPNNEILSTTIHLDEPTSAIHVHIEVSTFDSKLMKFNQRNMATSYDKETKTKSGTGQLDFKQFHKDIYAELGLKYKLQQSKSNQEKFEELDKDIQDLIQNRVNEKFKNNPTMTQKQIDSFKKSVINQFISGGKDHINGVILKNQNQEINETEKTLKELEQIEKNLNAKNKYLEDKNLELDNKLKNKDLEIKNIKDMNEDISIKINEILVNNCKEDTKWTKEIVIVNNVNELSKQLIKHTKDLVKQNPIIKNLNKLEEDLILKDKVIEDLNTRITTQRTLNQEKDKLNYDLKNENNNLKVFEYKYNNLEDSSKTLVKNYEDIKLENKSLKEKDILSEATIKELNNENFNLNNELRNLKYNDSEITHKQ
ncbi:MAG: plasmid recombination protein [Sulfurimonas sp.]